MASISGWGYKEEERGLPRGWMRTIQPYPARSEAEKKAEAEEEKEEEEERKCPQ
jgi:hypothetical protein